MALKVTRGIPGSGKSTYARAWVAEDPEHRVRVNRDDIRTMLGCWPIGTWPQEQQVTAIEQAAVRAALTAGHDVIVDATHLQAKRAKQWFAFDDDVEFIDFPVTLTEAVRRDSLRPSPIGGTIIRAMAKRYHIPEDGRLPKTPQRPPAVDLGAVLYKPDDNLATAFIFDLDGTLAIHNGRDPYDQTQYHTDLLDPTVALMLETLWKDHDIVVCTGRPENKRPETEAWLEAVGLRDRVEAMFMRAEGDERNDAIVKTEILHRDIAPRWHVLGAFDDRDRVVAAWRTMGIKTFQVAYGNF